MINPNSELAKEFWEHGRVEDCPIIDLHGHMGPWCGAYFPRAEAEGMLKTMNQANVKFIVFAGHESLLAPATCHAADIEAVRTYPDRFRAYFAINANSPDLKADLKRFQDNRDVFVGIKCLPDYFATKITDDAYTPFYEYANENELLFLCHTWGGSQFDGIDEAVKLVTKYPKIKFLAGHSFHGLWKKAAKVCLEHPNLYLELTAVFDERGPLETLLAECGSKKLIFGTDLPWFDTHHGIGYILSTDMSDDDRRNIFYRNAERLLGNYSWFKDLWGKGCEA